VSFMIEGDEDDARKEPAAERARPSSQGGENPDNGDKKLSAEEIEEMKRKTEHWWSLPAGTTQEEFDYAFGHFKEGRYFEVHMDVEWMDVQIQRACARLLSQDQFRCACTPPPLQATCSPSLPPPPPATRSRIAFLPPPCPHLARSRSRSVMPRKRYVERCTQR
jgi:hypothetical protein